MTAEFQTLLHQADGLGRQGRFIEAEAQYRRARTLDPRDLYAALGHGHCLRMLGRPGEAREVFTAAIAVKPDLVDAHHGLAQACHEIPDLAGAQAAYREVLRLEPTSLAAAIGLAETFNLQGRPDEALSLLAPLKGDTAPAGAALEQARGTARLLKEDNETALAHFDRTLGLTPGHPNAANGRALALQRLGRTEEALGALRKAVADRQRL